MKHIMLDIETMGNQSYSAILSIGAIKFNLDTGETGDKFYTTIDLKSCIDLGLRINADTLKWWMNQNEQAKKDLFGGDQLCVEDALIKLSHFINKGDIVWGNSARFDCGILQNAYELCNIKLPWDFRDERCVRTLVSFAPYIKENYKYEGTYHNALSDCYNQIGYCYEIWKTLKNE